MHIAGYAAIFDVPDKGGDIIRRGAFARSLTPGIPLLRQHDARLKIGSVERLEEDGRGLRVIARVDPDAGITPGQGLSFGYRVRDACKRTYRELKALDLIEISVVTHPMQPLARVLAVHSEGDQDGL